MINQAGCATADRRSQQSNRATGRSRLKRDGIHGLYIFHLKTRPPELLVQSGLSRGHIHAPCAHITSNSAQCRAECGSHGSLRITQITVAGTGRQPIGLPDGGTPPHPHGQAEVFDEMPQDRELLPVLFAQPKLTGTHQPQQAHHDCDHTIKVAGAPGTTEMGCQACRRLEPPSLTGSIGVDLSLIRTPQS